MTAGNGSAVPDRQLILPPGRSVSHGAAPEPDSRWEPGHHRKGEPALLRCWINMPLILAQYVEEAEEDEALSLNEARQYYTMRR
jgi:hypothetical protein